MTGWNEHPVVITVAPCGAEVTKEHNPAVPYTPVEIIDSTVQAAEAGATLVHLHVREPDGTPSTDAGLFREAIEGIRSRCDVVTMVSTGGSVWMDGAERMRGLESGPDLVGVESGSTNFGDDPFVTSPELARAIVTRARTLGIGLEVEAFEVGHVVEAVRWLEEGLLEHQLRINLVFGSPGSIDASPAALHAMLRPLPAETFWTVTAIGRHQRRMLALGLLHGAGGIRVGLEDAVYLRKGMLAPSNAALVEMAVELTTTVGREVATPAQARRLLALDRG